ncbi:1081_t:CDS:2, partial [Dentiscutata heterogama]
LSPKSIAEFFEKQEGIKDDFAKPHELCMNEFKFKKRMENLSFLTSWPLKSEDLDRYLKIKLSDLEKEQGSGENSPYDYDIDKDLREGLKSFSLDSSTAVKSIIHHSRKSILLCVEIMRVLSGNNASLIPLKRLALPESVELFYEITKSLGDRRSFIIKKRVADCNGHPRTLEKFYQLLCDDSALNTDVYSSLIERLAINLDTLFGKMSFSIVKMALLGNMTSLMCEIETTFETLTLRDLISSGIYINSLTDIEEAFAAAKISRDLLTTEYSFDDEVMDGKPFERFHANWELLYRALRNDGKEV